MRPKITDEPMLSFFERVKTWWSVSDQKQKIVILGGIGALLLVLIGTALVVTRPHYEVVFDNLSETDRASMVETLKSNGEFDPQISKPGAIELPTAQIPAARMKLAKEGKLPKGAAHWGPKEILSANPMAPPGTEDVLLKTVREGEIASALETQQGVAAVNVLITSPEKRLFADNQNHPKASVSITENGQGELNRATGKIFASLVCNAVDGMTPSDVVIVTSSGNELWNGDNADGGGEKLDLDHKASHEYELKIQSALDTAFGMGNTKVVVRADVDNSEGTVKESNIDSTGKPITLVKHVEIAKGKGTAKAGGIAGSDANMAGRAPATKPDDSGTPGSIDTKDLQQQNGTNSVERETKLGTGGMKGLAISVIANTDKVPDAASVKSIVDGIMGGWVQKDANGAPLPNQAFSTTVTSVKFDGSSAQAAKDAADRLAGQQRMQQLMSLLPIGAVLAVALLVAKQVGKISRAVLPALPDESASNLAEMPEGLEGGDGVEALPGAAGGMSALPSGTGGHGEGYDEYENSALPEMIRDRVDLPLESLKQMATDRPEMVATLIKSMMLGERG